MRHRRKGGHSLNRNKDNTFRDRFKIGGNRRHDGPSMLVGCRSGPWDNVSRDVGLPASIAGRPEKESENSCPGRSCAVLRATGDVARFPPHTERIRRTAAHVPSCRRHTALFCSCPRFCTRGLRVDDGRIRASFGGRRGLSGIVPPRGRRPPPRSCPAGRKSGPRFFSSRQVPRGMPTDDAPSFAAAPGGMRSTGPKGSAISPSSTRTPLTTPADPFGTSFCILFS